MKRQQKTKKKKPEAKIAKKINSETANNSTDNESENEKVKIETEACFWFRLQAQCLKKSTMTEEIITV